MKKLRVLSLFSGIGAFEKALKNCEIDYDLVGFSEIDKYAISSYCSIHNEDKSKNMGDITKIDLNKLPTDIDILTHGSPCVAFSVAGKQLGGDEGSGTPSSLLWYSVKIIDKIRPKMIFWENVANVLSSRHSHNFIKYLNTLSNWGYNNYYYIFDGQNHGVAQKRKRIICVSIKGNLKEMGEYKLVENIDLSQVQERERVYLKDMIEKEYPENMILQREVRPYDIKRKSDCICVGQSSNPGSQGGKVYSVDGLFPTICAGTHGYSLGYIMDDGVARKITPLEAFRLMGFSDKDYKKVKELGLSETQMYKQAGNSIVVPMLEDIYKYLFKLD